MRVTTCCGVTPGAGRTPSAFGSGVCASGFAACTACSHVPYLAKIVGLACRFVSCDWPTILMRYPPGCTVTTSPSPKPDDASDSLAMPSPSAVG